MGSTDTRVITFRQPEVVTDGYKYARVPSERLVRINRSGGSR
jgi:hypothetical protein